MHLRLERRVISCLLCDYCSERDEFERVASDLQKQHLQLDGSYQAAIRERDQLSAEVTKDSTYIVEHKEPIATEHNTQISMGIELLYKH